MKIKALANFWETKAKATLTEETYEIRLPVEEAAKLAALAEMYPKRSKQDLLSDLLTSAMEELENSFPYVAGNRVVAVDELGDPMYEDIGPTPRFLDLCRKYHAMLKGGKAAANG